MCRECKRELGRGAFRLSIPTQNGSWDRFLEYRVEEGVEMDLEEIARVAGVTKERVRQVFEIALRKFARRAAVARLKEHT